MVCHCHAAEASRADRGCGLRSSCASAAQTRVWLTSLAGTVQAQLGECSADHRAVQEEQGVAGVRTVRCKRLGRFDASRTAQEPWRGLLHSVVVRSTRSALRSRVLAERAEQSARGARLSQAARRSNAQSLGLAASRGAPGRERVTRTTSASDRCGSDPVEYPPRAFAGSLIPRDRCCPARPRRPCLQLRSARHSQLQHLLACPSPPARTTPLCR